ncbi:hypothetical protein I4U23_020632 [Adineta vaga]|nr:hypothetical protein I4U23_020632 [Adineta vaga]
MTTLTTKFQDITKQLQQLTIWRPNERNPLLELDRWRTDAHQIIEQLYNRKRHEIELLSEKHEREFLRQLARQRLQLNNVQKKLTTKSACNAHLRAFNDNTIFNELQTIERDINTHLGRAEIVIETNPLNCDGLVTLGLKTYLSSAPLMYSKEVSYKDSPKKPMRRPASEVQHAYDKWLFSKNEEETAQRELCSARQKESNVQEKQSTRREQNTAAFKRWEDAKREQGAFKKKKVTIHNNDDNNNTEQEDHGT